LAFQRALIFNETCLETNKENCNAFNCVVNIVNVSLSVIITHNFNRHDYSWRSSEL